MLTPTTRCRSVQPGTGVKGPPTVPRLTIFLLLPLFIDYCFCKKTLKYELLKKQTKKKHKMSNLQYLSPLRMKK